MSGPWKHYFWNVAFGEVENCQISEFCSILTAPPPKKSDTFTAFICCWGILHELDAVFLLSGWMTAYCWRSNIGSVITHGCGYSQDPFICKHKHVILYWWDHRRECTQNDTEEECEHSPAYWFGVWLRVCSREGLFHPGEDTCCERYTLTHASDTRRPLKVHPSLRRVKTSDSWTSAL